jgi:hypothetical protein
MPVDFPMPSHFHPLAHVANFSREKTQSEDNNSRSILSLEGLRTPKHINKTQSMYEKEKSG